MIQLEKKLEESAKALSDLNLNHHEESYSKDRNETIDNNDKVSMEETDIVQEMVKQIEIPLAYNANAEVILTQDSINRTLLDIKV